MVLQPIFYLDVQDYTVCINSHNHGIPLFSSATLLSTPNVVFGASTAAAAAAISGDDHDYDDDDKDRKKHKKCKKRQDKDDKHKKCKKHQRLAKYGLRETVRINFSFFNI
jgi:hypothetical protein